MQRPTLVFTSAGENGNVAAWLAGARTFDLCVVCYGGGDSRYRHLADRHVQRKGSKLQNLRYTYQQWPDRFTAYRSVMVIDDDILISGTDLSRLFEIRDRYGL